MNNINIDAWKEAREYSFQMLQLLINASANTEALQNLEQDISALNDKHSSNIYLVGMLYTFEDIAIFQIGKDKVRDERLFELFTHISDLIQDNDESLLPPIEIFDPIKENDFDKLNVSDINFSQNEQHIENKNNEGNTMENTQKQFNFYDNITKAMNTASGTESKQTNSSNNGTETKKSYDSILLSMPKEKPEKSGWCKYILGGIGVVASGAAAYYAYNYFKNKNA